MNTIKGLFSYYKIIDKETESYNSPEWRYDLFSNEDITEILNGMKKEIDFNIIEKICANSNLNEQNINKLAKLIDIFDYFNYFIENKNIINNTDTILHLALLDTTFGFEIINNDKISIEIKQKIVDRKLKQATFK